MTRAVGPDNKRGNGVPAMQPGVVHRIPLFAFPLPSLPFFPFIVLFRVCLRFIVMSAARTNKWLSYAPLGDSTKINKINH